MSHHTAKDKKDIVKKSLQNSNTSSKIGDIKVVNLDSCNAKKIEYPNLVEPKTFYKIGQVDTLKISPELVCISKCKYKHHNSEFDSWSGEFKIIFKGQEIFSIDKTLSLGIFEFDRGNMSLSFPVYTNYSDDMQTGGYLVLIDLNKKKIKNLKRGLSNTINAFFSHDGESLFYLTENNMYKYDIKSNTQSKVLQFDNNSNLPLYMRSIGDSKLEFIYLKDTTEDHVGLPDTPFKTEISLDKQIF